MTAPETYRAPDVKVIVRTLGPLSTSLWFTSGVGGYGAWMVGTNGHFLVGYPKTLAPTYVSNSETGKALLTDKRRAAGDRLLTEWPATPYRTVPHDALLEWARAGLHKPAQCVCVGTGHAVCWQCAGEKETSCKCPCGQASHRTKCGLCHGVGLTPCTHCGLATQRPGQLYGELIDRSYLAQLLFLMPAGHVSLFIDRQFRAFRFEVDGVRGVVAFLFDENPERFAGAPVWPAPATPATK